MVQHGLSCFGPTEVILIHERKVWKHEAKLSVSKFLKCIKITSVDLKRDNSENSNVIAGPPVPL